MGTQVSIAGTDFTATSTVTFNGVAVAVVAFNSAISLTATVPAGATTGRIAVANSVGSGSSATDFTVTIPQEIVTGNLLLEDNFAYASGEFLIANGWVRYSSNTAAPIRTSGASLTQANYPRGFEQTADVATFAGSSAARLTGGGEDVSRGFSAGSATTFYAAAVVSVTNPGADGYFMAFRDATNASAAGDLRGKVFVQQSGAGFKFGLSLNSGTSTVVTSTIYALNTPYLVVVKCNAGVDPNATSLFVYAGEADATEPGTPTLATTGTLPPSSTGSLNAVALRQDNNEVKVDGVRVATGWGSVIGRPVFTSPAATINAGNYYAVNVANADVVAPARAVNVERELILTSGKVTTSAANSLTLYQAATVSRGSDASFVSGPVRRTIDVVTTPTSFVFPVGKGAFYRPLTLNINSQSTASNYNAEQREGNPGQLVLNDNGLGSAPIKRVSVFRSFELSSTAASNASGTVTLSFGAGDGVNQPTDAGLVVAARNSIVPLWTNLSRSGSTGAGSGPGGPSVVGTLTSAVFPNTFTAATFVLGATNDNNVIGQEINPLPVELVRFEALRQPAGVRLAWATATEKNSARFEVQRSLDGLAFATVLRVAAQGNSSQPRAYAALDAQAPASRLYYRLRQVDLDGTVAFSSVVTVNGNNGPAGELSVYPNPTSERLTAALPAAEGRTYRVLNALGQVMDQGAAAGANPEVNVGRLPAGTYFLELNSATGRQVRRFVKYN